MASGKQNYGGFRPQAPVDGLYIHKGRASWAVGGKTQNKKKGLNVLKHENKLCIAKGGKSKGVWEKRIKRNSQFLAHNEFRPPQVGGRDQGWYPPVGVKLLKKKKTRVIRKKDIQQ